MKRYFVAAMLLLAFCGLSLAQSNVGRLVGSVKGPDGVIAGAKVVVKDNQTGVEKTTVTTAEGTYSFAQLDFGTYTVTVTADGFKTSSATDLKIDVGQEYSLNTSLEVGATTETITVTATAELVNASDAAISSTVGTKQMLDLPLNGRDPTSLIQLQAGMASNGATDTVINGQRSSFTNITRDGINVQDNFIRANATDFLPVRPTVDTTAEFTVTTQNAGADLGNGASQVQLVTPRGQNAYHGTLFEYNRNSSLAANDFFSNANGVARGALNRNQYGGNFSGAIIKDKLFFFGYYEGLRTAQSSQRTRTILTPSALGGNFTWTDLNGKVESINILQAAGISGIDPTIQSRILNNLPKLGNRPDLGDKLNTTGFGFNQSQASTRDQWDTRFDYEVNSKNTISAIFSYGQELNQRPDADGANGFNTLPVTVQPERHKFLSLAYRTTGATFTNEARGGFLLSAPTFDRTQGNPSFLLSLPLISDPEVNFQNQGRFTNTYDFQDNAEYDRGQHSIRFGADLQLIRVFSFGAPGIPLVTLGTDKNTFAFTTGSSVFTQNGGISSTQLATANSLLALLAGVVTAESETFNVATPTSGFVPGAVPGNHLNDNNLGIFGQDQWRVRPNLTFNYGVRWEYFSPVSETDGLALTPVFNGQTPQQALLNPNGATDFLGVNGGGKQFTKPYYGGFAPVLSFAWSPHVQNKWLGKLFGTEAGKTVVRGGFRQDFVNDEIILAATDALSNNSGLNLSSNATQIIGGKPTTVLNASLGSLPTIATPIFTSPRTFASNNALAGNFGAIEAIDPKMHAPRTNEINFGIQREIGANSAVEFRYVGGWSHSLGRAVDLNQINITSNGFAADFNRARANLLLSQAANKLDPTVPVSGAFNSKITGSQVLTVFPNLASGGLLDNSTVIGQLIAGTPADLGIVYIQNGLTGTVPFLANPNTGVADFLFNGGKYSYNSLQVEYRHRFSKGLLLQANYTFQKNLTNAQDSQSLLAPALDNNQFNLEYTRANSDQTHVFNFNGIYELPFGAGKRFLNQSGVLDRVVGGWEVSSIIHVSSGAPITITDARGTLNRVTRSGSQTPDSSLTPNQIESLIGVFRSGSGIFFFNPASGITAADGRAAEGFGTTPFSGQVFFNAAPGQTGSLGRALFNGPMFFNIDSSILKTFRVKENIKLQVRADAFNLFNRTNFFVGNGGFSINSANFGRITQDFGPRIMQVSARFSF